MNGNADLSHNSPTLTMGVQDSHPLSAFDADFSGSLITRAIFIDSAGVVEIKFASGNVDTLNLAPGMWHPILGFTRVVSSPLALSSIHVGY